MTVANRYLQPAELLAMFPGDAIVQALGTTRNANGSFTLSDPTTLAARLSVFIEQAEDEADAWISSQYDLPLRSVPPVIKPYIADLARYRVYSDHLSPVVVTRYEHAIAFFKQIAAKKVLLGVPNQDTAVAAKRGKRRVPERKAGDLA